MGALSEIALRRWSRGQFVSGRRCRQALKEICMKKTLSALMATAIMAGTLAATATDASAQRRHYGGWGPGAVIGGIIAGTVITGAILASRPGCYWASEPLYDRRGNVVGYTGQPVQICPGYRY